MGKAIHTYKMLPSELIISRNLLTLASYFEILNSNGRSRLTNFVGILSEGLRIAPPTAPATGYMYVRTHCNIFWCRFSQILPGLGKESTLQTWFQSQPITAIVLPAAPLVYWSVELQQCKKIFTTYNSIHISLFASIIAHTDFYQAHCLFIFIIQCILRISFTCSCYVKLLLETCWSVRMQNTLNVFLKGR